MSRPRSDTRERIQDVARELFASQGVQRHQPSRTLPTGSQITKPALYYHFASREDLVRSIVQPLIDEGERFIASHERTRDATPRELLEGYFDYHFAHRGDLVLVVVDV